MAGDKIEFTENEKSKLNALLSKYGGDISKIPDKDKPTYMALISKKIASMVQQMETLGVSKDKIDTRISDEIKKYNITYNITQPPQQTTSTPTTSSTQKVNIEELFRRFKGKILTKDDIDTVSKYLPAEKLAAYRDAELIKAARTKAEEAWLTKQFDKKRKMNEEQLRIELEKWRDEKTVRRLKHQFALKKLEIEKQELQTLRPIQQKMVQIESNLAILKTLHEKKIQPDEFRKTYWGFREKEARAPEEAKMARIQAEKTREIVPYETMEAAEKADQEKKTKPYEFAKNFWGFRKKEVEAEVEAEKAKIAAKAAEEDRPHDIRMAKLERTKEKWGRSTEEMKKRLDVRRAREFRPYYETEEEQKFEEESLTKPEQLRKKEAEQPVNVRKATMEADAAQQDIGHKIRELELNREKESAEQPLSEERLQRQIRNVQELRENEQIEHRKEFGGFWSGAKAKAYGQEKLKGWSKETTAAPGKALSGIMQDYIGSFGKGFKTRLDVGRGQLKSAFFFAIYFPITIWSVTTLAGPILEGWFGMPIVPTYLVNLLSRSFWIVMAAMFGIVLPPSLVLGKSGLDFESINKVFLAVIAISASMWGANQFFIPAVKAAMPNEYAMMMCLVKYSGNMQICMLNQTQQVQVQKTGTYQTLALTMGIESPTRTIPPMNPNPIDRFLPYYFAFTLKNTNEIGSPYEINVTDPTGETGIEVTASQSNFKENRTAIDYPYYPRQPIKPGGYVIAQAKFDKDPTNQHNLPFCTADEPYTYFYVNVTTDQTGGGSSKFGIIENSQGIDNQNFMYFFDPDVKTQPGPVDVYVYTVPFVLPVDRVNHPTNPEPFLIFIPIENKGSGHIESITVDLYYDSNTLVLDPNGFNFYCMSKTCPVSLPKKDEDFVGELKKFTFENEGGSINPGETYVIYNNNGTLRGGSNFVGKSTNLISVVVVYSYKQQFDEQIACIQQQTANLPQISCNCDGQSCAKIECGGSDTADLVVDQKQFYAFEITSEKDVTLKITQNAQKADYQAYPYSMWISSTAATCPSGLPCNNRDTQKESSCPLGKLPVGTYYFEVKRMNTLEGSYTVNVQCA